MKKTKTIAVHIQSEVQFYSLEPLLRDLVKGPYKVTILIEKHLGDNDGWREMSAGTIELMKEYGYSPKYTEDYKNKEFDLCLTPYADRLIKAKCNLKYEYGGMRIKPRTTYAPEILSGFHGFLCTNEDEANLFSAYGKTFKVDSLRFLGKRRVVNKKKKKIVLFAPTFNDDGSAEDNAEIVRQLKKKYYVIVKSHHGTKYLKKNLKEKRSLDDSEADEIYGSEKNLIDLIMRADICLTGSSGVIADALYCGIPCVVFAHNLDYFKWKNLHTIQYKMYHNKQLIAYSDAKKTNDVIVGALTKKYKDQWYKNGEEMIPKEFRTGVEGYLKIINYFLNSSEAEDYIKIHDYYMDYWDEKDRLIRRKDVELEELRKTIRLQQETIEDFQKRKLYKLADVAYNLEGKILRIKQK